MNYSYFLLLTYKTSTGEVHALLGKDGEVVASSAVYSATGISGASEAFSLNEAIRNSELPVCKYMKDIWHSTKPDKGVIVNNVEVVTTYSGKRFVHPDDVRTWMVSEYSD